MVRLIHLPCKMGSAVSHSENLTGQGMQRNAEVGLFTKPSKNLNRILSIEHSVFECLI